MAPIELFTMQMSLSLPLGVGIMCVEQHVVAEALLVLVAGIAAHFYCVVRGPSLVHILSR